MIDYTLKKHPRAKRVKLKFTPRKGLELVVPYRFDIKNIPQILDENKKWIDKQLTRIQINTNELPENVNFHAVNCQWNISYIASDTSLKIIKRPHQEIVLMGDITNKPLAKELLRQWLRQEAELHLPQLLKSVSEEINLTFKKISIRSQQSRWGSCSQDKNISLNVNLLFLPYHLTRHILIHELCHTVHLNHSQKFWKLVANFDGNWEDHRKAIRKSEQWIPGWV